MNLDEYEKQYFFLYEAFAQTIRFILEKALSDGGNFPRPQSVQCRAKSIVSLERRLAEAGKLNTQTIEQERRDLAGARIIFYTNNDVDRIVASTLIRDNFEVEEDTAKIHHPVPETDGARYRAVHYTVRLREDRTRLPEYAKFAGLRCEIQIQTILNHAWSETSHDILYKDKLGRGYGEKAMEGIARRFHRIMDKYLIPAGYEIQKAQQDYERVLHGKEFFDKDITKLLDSAQNNNERYEILSALRDYALPNYDDFRAAYDALKVPLLKAVRAARETPQVNIKTTYGNMEGFKADVITGLVVEIIERLRYSDAVGTLELLCEIYRNEASSDVQQKILDVVQRLSKYEIEVYRRVGPMLQMDLVDYLVHLSPPELDGIRPIALIVLTEAIKPDVTGTSWKADSLVLSTGSVPVSDQLKEVRDKAVSALFAAYDRSADVEQRRAIFAALDSATRTSNYTQYPNELLATTLADAVRIVEFATQRSEAMEYELLQHLEHRFLYDYFRANGIAKNDGDKFNCQSAAKLLVAAIFKFRDTINESDQFVRYKVLVGFEPVYPTHWNGMEYDYSSIEGYRYEEVERYICEVGESDEDDLFALILKCAGTKSNDLATFPVFSHFLKRLAQQNPEVASRFFSRAPDQLLDFLPGLLNGLALSGRKDIYQKNLEKEFQSAKNLSGLARHLRYSVIESPDLARQLLDRAIEVSDAIAVIECFLLAVESYGTDKIQNNQAFLRDALAFLNEQKDARWARAAWFLQSATKFFDELTPDLLNLVLQGLGNVDTVDYQIDRILTRLAERHVEAVWDYFGSRMSKEVDAKDVSKHFAAVPFSFHGLEKPMSKDPHLAIKKGMEWFAQDRNLFRYRGGRVLSNAFPKCTLEFSTALAELVKAGQSDEADFALSILQNYHGEISTHVVVKEIVALFHNDGAKMSHARICIDNTGVVSGEFGFVEAWRAKKALLMDWLSDERPQVKSFAEKHISELDLMIVAEQRRAEAEKEMRKRNYGDDDDDDAEPVE